MWLDPTPCARRKPANEAVALLTARTAAPAVTVWPAAVRAVRVTTELLDSRPLVDADAARDHLRAQTEREPARMDVRCCRQESAAAPEERRSAAGAHVVLGERLAPRRVRRPPRRPRSSRPSRRPARRRWRRRASVPGGTRRRRLPLRTSRRSRARSARKPGTPRPRACRRRGRAGSAGRPRASRRSRRCARSARGPRAPPRARRCRAPARAPAAARRSRARGSRRPTMTTSAVVSPRERRRRLHGACLLEPVPVPRVPRAAHPVEGILSWLRGGGSSVGRAPGCDPGGRGFKSRPPPCPIFRSARPPLGSRRPAP